ncbi:MAG: hypothetical protein JWN65_286 [Solirubrobacterales bacterium]|nr:hypothetical protein [Solirubrobacterales bacterium]
MRVATVPVSRERAGSWAAGAAELRGVVDGVIGLGQGEVTVQVGVHGGLQSVGGTARL